MEMLTEQLRQLQSRILQHTEVAAENEPTYNALDFSTQDPYPGDDLQLKAEREILHVKFKVTDQAPKAEVTGGKDPQGEVAKYLKVFNLKCRAYHSINVYYETRNDCLLTCNFLTHFYYKIFRKLNNIILI
jgi:hypothetical protein